MDPLRVLCETQGYFTRAHARDVGYDDRAVIQLVRAKVWHRFRRGYYSFTDIWNSLDEVGRHRVRSRAVLHSLGPSVALSHVSGLVAHGVTVWGVPLDRVHVTRLDKGAGRIEGDVEHHEGVCRPGDVLEVDGQRVLRAARCAIEQGSRGTGEVALSLFDSVLHLTHCSDRELFAEFELMQYWRDTRHLHIPVRMADGRSESPGESRGRWLCWSYGLPAPQSQFEVHRGHSAGHLRLGMAGPRVARRVRRPRQVRPTSQTRAGCRSGRLRRETARGSSAGDHRLRDGQDRLERL
jgi:hypothetical protein